MTLEVNYSADGVSSVYPFPFAIETDADCHVLLDGLSQTGGYSIRGQGSIDGGAVVFDSQPVAGVTVTLRRRGELSVSAADTAAGYLADKLVAGDNIALTTETAVGGGQQVRIDADLAFAFADVADKLKAGDNITLTTETAADGSQQVRIDAAEFTVNALLSMLEEGDNVTLTFQTGGDGVQRVRIDATQPDMSNVLYRDTSAVVEAGFWSKPVALSASNGVATPDALAGTVFTLTLMSDVTLGFPSGMVGKAGMFMVVAKQDAVGGHVLALAPGYALASGEWSTAANAVNLLWVTSDGSGTALDVVISQRGV